MVLRNIGHRMNTAEEPVIWEMSETSRKGEGVDNVNGKLSNVEKRDFHQTDVEKNSGKYNMREKQLEIQEALKIMEECYEERQKLKV